jgi:hypothetical protein
MRGAAEIIPLIGSEFNEESGAPAPEAPVAPGTKVLV